MTDTPGGSDDECDGYTVRLMDAGEPKAVRWLPMPISEGHAKRAAMEFALDTGLSAVLIYHGKVITVCQAE